MDIRLDQHRILVAVDRLGSFSAAAAELHRVPSAISYQMRTLEEQVGVALFEKVGRGLRLTDAGKSLVATSKAVLAAQQRWEDHATLLATGWEPELRIVCDGALPTGPIVDAMAALQADGVPTQVLLDIAHQEGVIEQFTAERAHLMLCLGFDEGEDTSAYVCHPLPPLPMSLVARTGHPVLDGDAASDHVEWIVRDSARKYRDLPKRSFIGSQQKILVGDFHTKLASIRGGLGFGWMPDHLILADLQAGHLVRIPHASGGQWTYQPMLCHPAGTEPGPAAARVIRLLTSNSLMD